MRSSSLVRVGVGVGLLSGAWAWVAAPRDARADEFEATRSEALVERAHDIALTIHDGHAELVVQRTVFNGGDRHDQAMFWIDVPGGGVAVGLRTRAMLRGRPHWYDGELLEAELAAARYRELTGIGGYYPKDPALLSWRSAEQLALQVFPCPPQETKAVEYTLLLPTNYEDGRHHLELPAMGTETTPAIVQVRGASARDQVFVDGLPVGRGAVVSMDDGHAFALGRAEAPTFDGGLAVVPISDGRVLFHYDLEAAPTISQVPRDADVVVLLDRSRSLGDEDLAAEVTLARSYLTHFERPGLDARAAVVAFDRRPEDLSGGLAPVGETVALLEHTTLVGRNGSHLDAALAHAEALLDRTKPGRARRVVVLTDRQMRASLPVARIEALARRTGALVHVVDATVGETGLERVEEDDPWSAVPRRTGGVLWTAQVEVGSADIPRQVDTFEELARPVRVHHLEIEAPGIQAASLGAPETLVEGTGTSALLLADRSVRHVVMTGLRWATPVRKVLLPSADEAERWSALAFGTDLTASLSEPEMMVLAVRGHAVSPVTSYLAIEPGVRPSTEGLEAGEGLGLSGFGSGSGGSSGAIGLGHRVAAPDRLALLRAHLDAARQACGAGPKARAVLETTFAEIVDITTVRVDGDAATEDCVREALWGTLLEGAFDAPFAAWDVEI